MGGVPAARGVGGGFVLLDEVDEGEAALADLAEDAEAALVDPHVAAASRRVVEGAEPRDGAAHPPSPPDNPGARSSHRRLRLRWWVSAVACFVGSMLVHRPPSDDDFASLRLLDYALLPRTRTTKV